MIDKIRTIFTIPELRQKILLTLGLLAIYRIGWQIPLPIVDPEAMNAAFGGDQGIKGILTQVSMFTGSQLTNITIFGLGIMPYISASIIFQLLATVYEPLEKLQKEGESGRKKINEYTRYATVFICLIQSFSYVYMVSAYHCINKNILQSSTDNTIPTIWVLTSVLIMTAGTCFLMWLGEQIDEYGIGNGISMLIMAGIIAQAPKAIGELGAGLFKNGLSIRGDATSTGIDVLLILIALFVIVVVAVVYITRGQRRIPMQSAKHVRGRRVYGGNRQYLPLKVNQAGVMPIIFASSLLMFPYVIFAGAASFFASYPSFSENLRWCAELFQRGEHYVYIMLYIGLIFFFCYFWTAVTFNPKDMADNLKNYGSFIPGYRPGKRTSEYLEKVMIRITYVGAAFLAIIAIIPQLISGEMGVSMNVATFFGGTSLLIAVSVIIDLVDKIDSHLIMRNYKGLLNKEKN
ncbi:MAG: preprotein translocase subunit SecY [Thermoguttaceae bacterium]